MPGLLRVFYEPEKLFPELSRRGAWRVPLAAALLVTLLSSIVVVEMIGMQTIMRNQMEAMPRVAEQLGQDRIDEMARQADTPARKVLTYVSGVATNAVLLLLVAAILVGLLHVCDAAAGFGPVLAVCSYSLFAYWLVSAAAAAIIVGALPDHSGLEVNNLVKLNPTIFLDRASTARPLYTVASSLDLLSFWALFLIALGLSKVAPRLSLSKALVLVLIPWAVYVAGKAGISALF